MGSPHILENIRIPKFDPQNQLYPKLAELSQRAHELAVQDEGGKAQELKATEEEIDELAAKLWALTDEELTEIRISLEELR